MRRDRTYAFYAAVIVAAVGCGGGGDDGTGPGPNNSVASVVVQPATVTLITFGATSQLTAEARTSSGSVVSGQSYTWASSSSTVASVSTTGMVTAVANGTATITATVSGGSVAGSAQVTVQAVVPFAATRDTTISGTVTTTSVSIPAGVTVTANGPLTMRSAGLISIAGTLRSACGAVDIQGDTAVTVTGTVANGCDQPTNPGTLRIAARGELTLDGATIVSSGDIKLTNNPSLAFNGASLGVAAAGPGVPFTRVKGSTVRYHAGATGPNPAAPGSDGTQGGPGTAARPVVMELNGNAIFEGGTLLWGQDGGRGGNGTNTAATPEVTASGGIGGKGGLIRISISGKLTYQGAANIVRAGAGGNGGFATVTATANPTGGKAPSATATGGDGAEPGVVDIRAGGGIEIATPGALVVQVTPGRGGLASANGALGANANGNNPAQEGGNATARGGKGGSTPDAPLIQAGVTGAPIFEVDASIGGDATAVAGDGGNGQKPQIHAAKGGNMTATGGNGGNARLRNHLNVVIGRGGNGADAIYRGGNGGHGWSDCLANNAVEPGGNGGKGGDAVGGVGLGGTSGAGLPNGVDGDAQIEVAGNGGYGGAGQPGGAKGLKGADNVNPRGNVVLLAPTFTDGQAGPNCPIVEVFSAAIPPTSSLPAGAVNPGTYSGGLFDLLNVNRGTLTFVAGGTAGNIFRGTNPDRLGWRTTLGYWSLMVGTAVIDGLTVCPVTAAAGSALVSAGTEPGPKTGAFEPPKTDPNCISAQYVDMCLLNTTFVGGTQVILEMRSSLGIISTAPLTSTGCKSGIPVPAGTVEIRLVGSGSGNTADANGFRLGIIKKRTGT